MQHSEIIDLKLDLLLQNLPFGILMEDESRHITHVNESFCKIFKIPTNPKEMVGTDCSNAAEESKDMFTNPEEFMERIFQILTERKPAYGDILYARDGRILQRDYVPVYDQDNKFQGNLWIYSDITDVKTKQDTLQEKTAELEKLNKFMLNREQKMIELKNRIRELEQKSDEDLA